MEISLFQPDEPLRFERIIIYPYPDLKRIWVRAWTTAVQDQQPNIEIIILNPDGSENNSVYLMSHAEQRLETTMHMRKGVPGTTYHVVAVLSLGVNDQPEHVEQLLRLTRDVSCKFNLIPGRRWCRCAASA